MALVFNGTSIPSAGNVIVAGTSVQSVRLNNTEYWKKANQLWPGNTWSFATGGGYNDAQAYEAGNNLVLVNGSNGAMGQAGIWADVSPWNTLSFTMSGGAQYSQFHYGVYSGWTNVYNNNAVRAQLLTGAINLSGTYSINVSDLTGGRFILAAFYGGSIGYTGTVYVTNVILT